MGIRLENLVVKFGDFKAINDVTLQIPKEAGCIITKSTGIF